MAATTEPLIIMPSSATHCIIWLHGLGASGADLAHNMWNYVVTETRSNFRAIFPDAISIPVAINGNYVMPAWYNIYSLNNFDNEDHIGFSRSLVYIHDLIDQQLAKGFSSENIFLAGFSQGGAMALHAALRYHSKLAGVIAASSYLPFVGEIKPMQYTSNVTTPILFLHGHSDEVLPYNYMEIGVKQLRQHSYDVAVKSYEHGHSFSLPEINDIGIWLQQFLS